MSFDDESARIAEVVRETYRDAGLPWPPETLGPAPLDQLIAAYPVTHEEVPGLCRSSAAVSLGRWGVRWSEIPAADPPLAGFLYANASCGHIFVRRGDILARRRFTAAHELGHYRLHLVPELAQAQQVGAEKVEIDGELSESDETELAARERQANRFAAQIIMPEPVCRTLFERYARKYGNVPRFLIHHIGGDLLVSREAMAWRLYKLNLIEKPTWLGKDRGEPVAPSSTT